MRLGAQYLTHNQIGEFKHCHNVLDLVRGKRAKLFFTLFVDFARWVSYELFFNCRSYAFKLQVCGVVFVRNAAFGKQIAGEQERQELFMAVTRAALESASMIRNVPIQRSQHHLWSKDN